MPRPLAALYTLLWLALSCVELASQEIRLVRAPDGSRFVLVPTGGPPVVHWVSLLPAGVKQDPPGLEGISTALARASLSGTSTLGSENPLKEEQAIARARSLARQLANDTKNPALRALFAQAQAEVRRLARPLAWEKALRRAPASGSRLLSVPGGVLLRVTTTTRGLRRVAELLKDRRDHALLRGVHGHFDQVRRERKSRFDLDPRTGLRRRLLEMVFKDHCFKRFHALGQPRSLTFEVAANLYRQLSDPGRLGHVLTGGFDIDTVEAILKQIYEHAPEVPPKVEPPQTAKDRSPNQKAASEVRDTLALGCAIPKTISAQDLVVFVMWLAGDQDSYLADALRARGHPRVIVRGTAPFPDPGGVLLVEITKPGAKLGAHSKIRKDLEDVLRKAMEQAPEAEQLARAHSRFLASRARALASPGA
ncbi:MAG: hypothetical protein V3U11_05260, partial [Planctomycetota bacterium]